MKISTSFRLRRMSLAAVTALMTVMVVVFGPVSPVSAGTVNGVTSTKADGTYTVGEVIPIVITFSESQTVTGTPQLTLETGTTDRVVGYSSGSPGTALTFNYTVQAGDTSADLDYVATTSLALNGGTINNTTGGAASTLTLATPGALNSISDNQAIVIDTAAPTVTGVSSSSANGTYGFGSVGGVVPIQVTFSETVIVAGGTPTLTLETGVTDRVATYSSGSGTAVLTFNYTVQAGDTSADLDYVATTSLALAGATIRDFGTTQGNDAVLTLPTPGAAGSLRVNKAIVLDTTAPTVTGVSSSTTNGTYKTGDVVSIQVTFSEAVTVVGTPQIALELGATDRAVNYSSGSGTAVLTFNYAVSIGDSSADLDYMAAGSLALNGGTIRDTAQNNATLTLATPGAAGSLGANKAIVINATVTTTAVPTITSVSPSSGPATGGTMVTLTGTNLTGTTSVTFDGVAGTSITSVSATSVTVVTPAHAVGVVNVVLTTSGGSVAHIGGFTYVATPTTTAPTITVPTAPNNILGSAAGTPILINTPPLPRIAADIELAVRGNGVTLAIQSPVLLNTARIVSYGIVLRSVKGDLVNAKTVTIGAKGSIKLPKFKSLAVGRYRIQITAMNTKGKQLAKWISPIVRITG